MDNFSIDDVVHEWQYPCPICKKRRHDFYLEEVIHYAIKNSETMFIAWVGKSRSGKSWSEIIHGCRIFDVEHFNEENIFFPENDGLNSLRKWYKENTKSLAILEEITSGDVTDWWSKASKTLQWIINTQGFRNNILFINSPILSLFPRSVKNSISYRVICSRRGKYVRNRIERRDIIHDWKSDDVKIRYNLISTIKGIRVPDNNRVKFILNDYEVRKREWNDKMLDNDYFFDSKEKNPFSKPKTEFVIPDSIIDRFISK